MKTEYKTIKILSVCLAALFSMKTIALDKAISVAASAAGGFHTCAVTSTGGVKCWGFNSYGQLGDNTTVRKNIPSDVVGVNAIGILGDISNMATGYNHTCGVTSTGYVKCWGNNSFGQLGDGSGTDRLTPVDVRNDWVSLLGNISNISAGERHTCALTKNGGAKCWGDNSTGQLGDGGVTRSTFPKNVVGLANGVKTISTGGWHNCALTTSGGVKCWGANNYGQLGDNTIAQKNVPVDVVGSDGVGMLGGVSAIAAGYNHTCALMNTSGVKCWGANVNGQLGNNTKVDRKTPVDVVGPDGIGLLDGVDAVTAGAFYTCAHMVSGDIKCWGSNKFGQLGDNTLTDKLAPVAVRGVNGVGLLRRTSAISAGFQHACALMRSGGVTCWGSNMLGELGDKTYVAKYTPVNVFGLGRIVKNDYNKNKYAGWIWKGESNGYETQSQIWQVTFPLQQANWATPTRYYPPSFPDQVNWDIVTTGDFNSDGVADFLWRNKVTAEWKVWQMQDGTRVGQNTLADFDLVHAWKVVGSADTDNDDDDDVIFNNPGTGEVLVWEMQGYQLVAAHSLGTKSGYVVNRLGDFNGDGDTDLLLRLTGGDQLLVWEIENNNFIQEVAFKNNTTGWDPVCAGDFDTDGDDDIMLVESSTQQEKWFEIQNNVRVNQHFSASNTGFRFLGCGDYNGDGAVDVLWQRNSDDMNRLVLQQNWGTTKQTVYTNPFGGANPAAAGYGFRYRGNAN